MESLSIYLHIPFCQQRCGYCDFNTYAGVENLIPAYVEALSAEIQYYGRLKHLGDIQVGTIYFGGGTPSLLAVEQFEGLVGEIRKWFVLAEGCEITIEANPGTVSLPFFEGIRNLDVNRLSLGMQSSDEGELVILDRRHGFPQVGTAVGQARKAGFSNISLDLIYGIPGQTLKSWQQSLEDAVSLNPEHLSLYSLTVEEGTVLASRVAAGEISAPDDDSAADMYEFAMLFLQDREFVHYEISNWGIVRNGSRLFSRHNLQYWHNLPYLGLGAGAHGFFQGIRYENVGSLPNYIKRMKTGNINSDSPVVIDYELIDRQREMNETMMMGLRLLQEGVSSEIFESRFGVSLISQFGGEIERLINLGLLEWIEDETQIVRLTPRGYLLGNQVFCAFV